LARFEFEFGTVSFVLPLSLFLGWRIAFAYLSGVQVAGAACRPVMRIMTGVGDLVQRIGDDQAQVGYSVAGRSGGQVMPCAICTMHIEIRSVSFLIEPQNQGRRFVSGLASKLLGWFLPV
jgi:hypothetical protein